MTGVPRWAARAQRCRPPPPKEFVQEQLKDLFNQPAPDQGWGKLRGARC